LAKQITTPAPQMGAQKPAAQQQGQSEPTAQQAGGTAAPRPKITDWASI